MTLKDILGNELFVSEELIFIQQRKMACTHITSILEQIFTGEVTKKHAHVSHELLESNRHVYSSIRNPWDWYLSLWTYGVQVGGGLKDRLVKHDPKLQLFYQDANDVDSFRKWLKFIHDSENSPLLGEGYASSNTGTFCGFMTFRYLRHCCLVDSKMYALNVADLDNLQSIKTIEDIFDFNNKKCFVDYFFRQELLEQSLVKGISRICNLNQEQIDMINNLEKTNTSIRPLSISQYYDEDTVELISKRDRFIVEKFNYNPTQD